MQQLLCISSSTQGPKHINCTDSVQLLEVKSTQDPSHKNRCRTYNETLPWVNAVEPDERGTWEDAYLWLLSVGIRDAEVDTKMFSGDGANILRYLLQYERSRSPD